MKYKRLFIALGVGTLIALLTFLVIEKPESGETTKTQVMIMTYLLVSSEASHIEILDWIESTMLPIWEKGIPLYDQSYNKAIDTLLSKKLIESRNLDAHPVDRVYRLKPRGTILNW